MQIAKQKRASVLTLRQVYTGALPQVLLSTNERPLHADVPRTIWQLNRQQVSNGQPT